MSIVQYSKKSLKILILLPYYNRPIFLANCIKSILAANEHYNNWELAFGDDGSTIPGEPIVREILNEHLDKITFINSNMSFEDKISQGLILGKMANNAIKNSNADIGIILCDDDELHPEYLRNLNQYFLNNDDVLYCYSKVQLFNPVLQSSENIEQNLKNKWNDLGELINPVNKLDASQVAWRLECNKKLGAWFKDSTNKVLGKPWLIDTDKSFFSNLFEKCGLCHETNFVGQFKGIHKYQLVWHKNASAASLYSYHTMTQNLAGKEF